MSTAAIIPAKRLVRLQVNGQPVESAVEPRTSLADCLRDGLNLTGTHIGCEHGICGACTVLVDGEPARACITLAAACEGARITTIEGLDEDEVTAELRAAFSREHALQCGYCTPGMLASARDVVLRLPQATERDIRHAMSGNLCRCTGYVGIVRAVQGVIEARRARGLGPGAAPGRAAGPVGSGHAGATAAAVNPATPGPHAPAPRPASPAASARPSMPAAGSFVPQATLTQQFEVGHPRERVWAFFGQLDQVVPCLPGASVIGTPGPTHVDTLLRVKVGPIVGEFAGGADVERDDAAMSGLIRGSARDARSGSITQGEIGYRLVEADAGTRVEVSIGYAITGPLAQFGRGAIVQDISRRMTEAFAANLQARLDGRGAAAPARELDGGALVWTVLKDRLKALWSRLAG